MAIHTTQISPQELYQRLTENPVTIYREAIGAGRSFSDHLERLNPSESGTRLDAFGRLLREAGIITRSDAQAGRWATPAITFFQPEDASRTRANRVLFVEFFRRVWLRTILSRATYLSTDSVPGSWQRPYDEATQIRWSQELAPAIPLSEIIAMTVPITGDLYKTIYLIYDPKQLRLFRVGESTDLPIAQLQDAENIVTLKKYGRGLQASYEQIRRMRVDKLAEHIAFIAIQSEVDKTTAALAIIINGDGNPHTAATVYNLTDLDSAATPGIVTTKAWFAFKMKFANPYVITGALMQEEMALQLALLNTGNANTPLATANLSLDHALVPINRTADNVRYGWTDDAPANKIVGFDRRLAIDHLTEIGADISEMERFITNQTQVITMSEVSGFAVKTLHGHAAKLLDVNA